VGKYEERDMLGDVSIDRGDDLHQYKEPVASCCACSALLTDFLLTLLFYPEEGKNKFL
jgi:hypothetical protein